MGIPSISFFTKVSSYKFPADAFSGLGPHLKSISLFPFTAIGNKVTGTIRGADNAFQHLHVSSLTTPSGVNPQATLRVSDVRAIQLDIDL